MARTQSKNYSEIRDSILRSAAKLFAAKGYPNASIEDLANACNSSRGALYHYFDSKERILADILVTHLDVVLDALKAVSAVDEEPVRNFRALMRTLMALNAQNQAEQITLLNEMNELDDAGRKLVTEKQREIVDIIGDALARLDSQNRMTGRRRKVYTMMILGALNYSYNWYRPDGAISPETYADMAVDSFIHGFMNQGGASSPPEIGGRVRERRQIRKEIV
jgi:AcrR family transcriptional regulator